MAVAYIKELWAPRDESFAVMLIKHDYTPNNSKFGGNIQTSYPKKNWSSLMLVNNEACKALTPEYVNSVTGLELHQFTWLRDESLIGEVPREWNHLVGEYPPNPDAKLIHFTLGGPWWEEFADCEFADAWRSTQSLVAPAVVQSQ